MLCIVRGSPGSAAQWGPAKVWVFRFFDPGPEGPGGPPGGPPGLSVGLPGAPGGLPEAPGTEDTPNKKPRNLKELTEQWSGPQVYPGPGKTCVPDVPGTRVYLGYAWGASLGWGRPRADQTWVGHASSPQGPQHVTKSRWPRSGRLDLE